MSLPLSVSTPNPPGPRHAWTGWLAGTIAAVLVIFVLGAQIWQQALPQLDGPLRIRVTFPAGVPGQIEPLVTTGAFGRGDFLAVRYIDAETGVLSYDAWGSGGPSSAPFPLHARATREIEIELPSLRAGVAGGQLAANDLRVALDGKELLREPVAYHAGAPDEFYVGVNPIGGTPATAFRGEIVAPNGRRLRGSPVQLFGYRQRVQSLIAQRPGHIVLILLAALVSGVLVGRIPFARTWARWNRTAPPVFAGSNSAPHVAFASTLVACVVLFTALITGGTFRVLYPESFGTFYDHQATSLLHGRLDVPDGALGGEAFIFEGRYYGYFGPTPALLRLPFAVAHVAFGQLSRAYMIAYYTGCLLATYALLCWATRFLCGTRVFPSQAATVLLTLSAGLGSMLFFLGARAYIYHEAILCGALFALWSAYFSLRHFETPDGRWWIAALASGVLALHARPPAGLFALFLLACVAVWHAIARWRSGNPRAAARSLLVAGSTAVGLATFAGVSYLKFRTFDGSPLRYNVQYTPERLARFQGKNFHVENVPHNVHAYVLAPDFHFERRFPYVFFGSGTRAAFAEARIDMEESTIAMPFTMAGLVGLTVLGGFWAGRLKARLAPVLLLLSVGVGPMALALFSAIATSHRYTADFCAFWIAGAACGLAVWDCDRGNRRRVALATAGALSAIAIGLTVLISIEYAGELVWGAAPETQRTFQLLRHTLSPSAARP